MTEESPGRTDRGDLLIKREILRLRAKEANSLAEAHELKWRAGYVDKLIQNHV